MYVTRRLSTYKKDPSALSLPPPDGPNSGILVIQDIQNTFLHTLCKFYSYDITTGLPYPQNTCLYGIEYPGDIHAFMAIPVLDQPLSTGLYYVIAMESNPYAHAGYAFRGKKGKKLTGLSACFSCGRGTPGVVAKPLEVSDVYQQFYFRKKSWLFSAVSAAPDGLVPTCLTDLKSVYSGFDRYNSVYAIDDDALGLDHSLRERLPKFDFLESCERSDAVPVGKWYCPFMFVKEQHLSCNNQTSASTFYEMSLVQQWIRVFFRNREDHDVSVPDVDLNVKTQVISVVGMANDHCSNVRVADGMTWYEGVDKEGQDMFMGLSTLITDKIDKHQESFGWVRESDKVKVVENFEGRGEWKRFGCYILVEKYLLKSLTKRLVLTIEFWHTHKLRCKWEYE